MTVSATPALPHSATAMATVGLFRVPGQPLYVVGTLDTGVTVLSQQYRALNLVWGLVSSGRVRADRNEEAVESIAIVGGGFAGLTVAAGLTKKEVNARITIFERRDTLLPLQQGSDSRWLHPHIYDWPLEGSESPSAALPILNWTAARASDVVVQVLRGWQSLLRSYPDRTDQDGGRLRIFCNTHHLQIASAPSADGQAEIEWVGEPRDPANPANPLAGVWQSIGSTEKFDVVILTVGFGLERAHQTSYWRNETFAQPQLGQARLTYIVSGAGDGAMIDLFRLRIAQYRQDRILAELFAGRDRLLARLRELDRRSRDGRIVKLFELFDTIWSDAGLAKDTAAVRIKLQNRLRHDTSVVLHVRQARFADLFDRGRVSFQNRLLAFLLFRVGGFQPSTDSLSRLRAEHGVPPERVIERHGTDRKQVLQDILSADLHPVLDAAFEDGNLLRQPDVLRWGGGFFDYPGPVPSSDADDTQRARWRREYLPSPTQAIAASFCAAIVGYLAHDHPDDSRLRVTFHRTLLIGSEEVLQQCCEYDGIGLDNAAPNTAGRTFEANHATIGAAYVLRQVLRTRAGAKNETIVRDMTKLQLNDSSRRMARSVQSIAAIPVIGSTGNVVGVLYIDSGEMSYFSDEDRMTTLVTMTQQFATRLSSFANTAAGRVVNNAFWRGTTEIEPLKLLADPTTLETLEPAPQQPPVAENVSQINFDSSDLEGVEG